jgi:hypothetical protein
VVSNTSACLCASARTSCCRPASWSIISFVAAAAAAAAASAPDAPVVGAAAPSPAAVPPALEPGQLPKSPPAAARPSSAAADTCACELMLCKRQHQETMRCMLSRLCVGTRQGMFFSLLLTSLRACHALGVVVSKLPLRKKSPNCAAVCCCAWL